MNDGTGLAEALLGLDGFKVLGVTEREHELAIAAETTASETGCWNCGVLADCQDRVRADIRDLACSGRPARLTGPSGAGGAESSSVRIRLPGPKIGDSVFPRMVGVKWDRGPTRVSQHPQDAISLAMPTAA